jgi:hypothetical protein
MSFLELPERVQAKLQPIPVTGCWLWTGALGTNGYGCVQAPHPTRGRNGWAAHLLHRWVYQQIVGPIPPGLVLDHLCRERTCANPDHLRVCTNAENTGAPGSLSPSAANSRKTHCIHGHEFTADNIYRDRGGWRQCRMCRRLSRRLRRLTEARK